MSGMIKSFNLLKLAGLTESASLGFDEFQINPWNKELISWTSLTLKFLLYKRQSREWEDKWETGRKYLQNTYMIKDFYQKYTKKLKKTQKYTKYTKKLKNKKMNNLI